MSKVYGRGACCGGALSAEEYTAGLAGGIEMEDCGCPRERSACSCGCDGETAGEETRASSCRQEPEPVEEDCCCKKSFREALELLDDEELTELLDLDRAAFVTDDYVAGAAATETVSEEGPDDNLVEPLAGTFRRFSPCTCDLLDIDAVLYAAPETPTGLTAAQVSLCELVAMAIQLAETEGECCLTAENIAERNFRRVKCILARGLTPVRTDEEECGHCTCVCSEDCCCAAGIKAALAEGNLSHRVSLAAGPLLLSDVRLLGTAGNVLVLANEEDYRIYFVCATKVQFLA